MRVGIVAPEFPPDVGGVETYSFEFARELRARGYEVSVVTVAHPQGEISVPGINVVPALKLKRELDAPVLRNFNVDLWHVTNAAYAWLAFEKKPVIVSVHGNDFISPYILVEAIGLYRLPVLWRVYGWSRKLNLWLGRRAVYGMIRRALPRATHVIANSQFTEAALLRRFPACKGRTSVGFVGVSDDYFQVKRVARELPTPVRLTTVCRLADKRKNVDRVLQAMSRLRHHDFTYTVIGDGPQRPRLEKLSRDLGLTERVEFLGFIPREQLQEKLAASDLLVLVSSLLPSSHEGFGIVYLEANACGTPVLAARLGGAAEAVEDGISGMFVENPTPDAISKALGRFFSGEIRFDSEACKTFARRFSWRCVVDHATQYYEQ